MGDSTDKERSGNLVAQGLLGRKTSLRGRGTTPKVRGQETKTTRQKLENGEEQGEQAGTQSYKNMLMTTNE